MVDAPFKIAALGDSTGVGVGAGGQAGYPDRLAKWLVDRGYRTALMNVSQSGATAATVRARQVDAVLAKTPDLILLGVGHNDLWRMTPIDRLGADLEHIGDRLATTGAPVLVANVIDLSLAPVGRMVESMLGISRAVFQARLDAVNACIAAMARARSYTLVDLHAISVGELAAHPEYFASDGFHGSAAGYQRWSEALRPAALAVAERWTQSLAKPASPR